MTKGPKDKWKMDEKAKGQKDKRTKGQKDKMEKRTKRTKGQKYKRIKLQRDKRAKGQKEKWTKGSCVCFFLCFCLFVVALLSKGTVYDISKYKTFLTKYDNIKMALWQFLWSLG